MTATTTTVTTAANAVPGGKPMGKGIGLGDSAVERLQKLLVERNSQRSIVRLTGVARMTIAKRIKKSGASFAAAAGTTLGEGPAQAVGSA